MRRRSVKSNGRWARIEAGRAITVSVAGGGKRQTATYAAVTSTETARFQRLNLAADDVTDVGYNGIRCYAVDSCGVLTS